MKVIKHRPKIQLKAPREIHPGVPFETIVILQARRPVEVTSIVVELVGHEQGRIGSGQYATTERDRVVHLYAQLSERAELPAGRSSFGCRFELPASAPPSYQGKAGRTEYVVSIRVAIPWWPDAKEQFELKVVLPPRSDSSGNPVVFSSAPEGPRAKEGYVEGSLSSSTVSPGERLVGAVALGNVDYNRFSGLTLAIVAKEKITLKGSRLFGSRTAEHELKRYEVPMTLADEPREGASMPFAIEVPQLLPLSHTSGRWAVSWAFEVQAKVRWGRDLTLRIPLSVVPRALQGERSQRSYLAPPSVGSDRLRGLWSTVAARWGLTLEEGGQMTGSIDDLRVEVRREHRGREGIFVVGEVSYPCLHLRLLIEPARALRRLVSGGGVEVGDGQWDSEQHVTGREPQQVKALASSMLDALAPFIPVTMDDSQLLVSWRDAGQRTQQLHRFVDLLLSAARALILARDAVPPPQRMAGDLQAWRALADTLGAKLQQTRMAADGTYEGLPALVATEWSEQGTPDHTHLSLRPELSIDDRYAVELTSTDTAEEIGNEQLDAAATRLPRAAAQQLAELVEGARSLSIAPRELALELPAPQRDHRSVLRKLSQLARLADALRPMDGPYR